MKNNYIRVWDIDDNETLLNLNEITNITKLDDEHCVVVFSNGNFMTIYIDTYNNILEFLGVV